MPRGTVTRTITCPRESCEHEMEFTVKWWSDPGRMYLANGDPGWPPESDQEIVEDLPDTCPGGHEWTPEELAEVVLRYENILEKFDLSTDEMDEDYGRADWEYDQWKDAQAERENE